MTLSRASRAMSVDPKRKPKIITQCRANQVQSAKLVYTWTLCHVFRPPVHLLDFSTTTHQPPTFSTHPLFWGLLFAAVAVAVAFVFMHKQNGCCNNRKLTANDICDMHHMSPRFSRHLAPAFPLSFSVMRGGGRFGGESATWHISVVSLFLVRYFFAAAPAPEPPVPRETPISPAPLPPTSRCLRLLALQVQLWRRASHRCLSRGKLAGGGGADGAEKQETFSVLVCWCAGVWQCQRHINITSSGNFL